MCCRKGYRLQTADCREVSRGKLFREAFTLVELMVVIVIIGLLAGAATMSVRSYLIRGKQSVARMEIAKIGQALDTYYTAYDKYPTSDQGLEALVEESEEFPDGLINKIPKDPWGNDYAYLQPGREAAYEVVSYGADKQEGGDAANRDITSLEVEAAD
jgi:general secretion pathway protein G